MGYYDYDNASNVSGRTAHSVRSKKPKVVVKKRSRSREREQRHSHRSDRDGGSDRDRDRERRRRRSDRSRSRSRSRERSRDRAPSLRDAAANLVEDALGEHFSTSSARGGGGGGGGGGWGGGGWNFKQLLGFGDHSRSSWQGARSSYYKRSSRHNLVHRTVKKIKKLLADLVHYAKTHPAKVFALVIVPLLTGGALTAMLARVGLRLPHSIERLVAAASRMASGDPSGLVAEAVRMVSGDGRSVAVARGARAGDYKWQRSEVHQTFRPDSGGGGGWTESLRRVTKTLF